MKLFLSFMVLLFLISGCSTIKVNVDYDDSYEFYTAKKVAIVHEYKVAQDSLLSDRIIKALDSNLESKNYTKVLAKDADLIFVFYTDVKDKTQINETITMGMRYRFGGMMVSTSTPYRYTEGTLVIDALNPQTKKIVWRGIGTQELDRDYTPQEKTKTINETVEKIMEKFPKQGEK